MWPISNSDNFLRVYADVINLDEKVQIKDFSDLKHTFLNVHIKSEFSQIDQN